MNFQELDNLLTHGSRVKPKNVPENPDSDLVSLTAPSKPTQSNSDLQAQSNKGQQKGQKKNSKISADLAAEEGVSKPQDKYKELQKKKIQLIPGSIIETVQIGKRITVFGGEDKAFILGLDKLGKLKKIKDTHCSKIISEIVKFQVTSTIFYQKSDGNLYFLDTPEQNSESWKDVLICENLGIDTYWSAGAGGTKLMVVRSNSKGLTPKLFYYSNVFNCLQPEAEIDLNFEVKSITVAKESFYAVSEKGQLYQGDYSKLSLVKIAYDTDTVKILELQKAGLTEELIENDSPDITEKSGNDDGVLENKKKTIGAGLGFGFNIVTEVKREKEIDQVFTNGTNTFALIADCKRTQVKDMSTAELSEMFEEIGLGKYKNSILFQRLTGETLLGFDEVDLQEKLGMMDQSEQNHLMLNMNIGSRDQ